MFLKIMEVVDDQWAVLLKKADTTGISRVDITCAFSAIKGQIRSAERDLIENVVRQTIEAGKGHR